MNRVLLFMLYGQREREERGNVKRPSKDRERTNTRDTVFLFSNRAY